MTGSYYETNTRIAVQERLDHIVAQVQACKVVLRDVAVGHWGKTLAATSLEAEVAISRLTNEVQLALGRQDVDLAKQILAKWEGKL